MRLAWAVIPLILIGIVGTLVLIETTTVSGPQITFSTDKEIYTIGEPVSIIMENTGDNILSGTSSPCGFDIFDKNGNVVESFWGAYLALCPFEPGEKISKTWSSKSYSDVPVRPGIYTLSAQYWDSNYEQRLIFEKQIEIIDSNNSFEVLNSSTDSENIQMLKNSELVFSGKLITKTQISSSNAYNLEFEIIENFRNAKEDTVTVYTHEGAWKGCAELKENSEYVIFANPKTHGTMTCYHAIVLPTEIADELDEYSSQIPWWQKEMFPSEFSVGEIYWLEQTYSVPGTGLVRVIDEDMDLNSENVDSFTVKVWATGNLVGIELKVIETNASTGIFEGTVVFVEDATAQHHLQVWNGAKLTAKYQDNTIPETLNVPFQAVYASSRILNES